MVEPTDTDPDRLRRWACNLAYFLGWPVSAEGLAIVRAAADELDRRRSQEQRVRDVLTAIKEPMFPLVTHDGQRWLGAEVAVRDRVLAALDDTTRPDQEKP